MTTYIQLPATGQSPYWANAVANFAALPAAGTVDGEVILTLDTNAFYRWDAGLVAWVLIVDGLADVSGPASSTDNALARFDGATGKVIQNSVAILSDAGALTGLTALTTGAATVGALSGPVKATAGVLSASAIDLASGEVTGTLPVGNGGLGLTGGTSGGVPYYSGASTIASSGALAANGVVLGGGAGASPTSTAAGIADQVLRVPGLGGAPAFGAIDLTKPAAVTGALPVDRGGTNSAAALANDKVMQSLAGAIVESPIGVTAPGDLSAVRSINQGIKVGAAGAATASCALEVSSTTGAFRLPLLTTAQRNLLTGADGMMIFNTDTSRFEGYFSGAWTLLHGWGF